MLRLILSIDLSKQEELEAEVIAHTIDSQNCICLDCGLPAPLKCFWGPWTVYELCHCSQPHSGGSQMESLSETQAWQWEMVDPLSSWCSQILFPKLVSFPLTSLNPFYRLQILQGSTIAWWALTNTCYFLQEVCAYAALGAQRFLQLRQYPLSLAFLYPLSATIVMATVLSNNEKGK